MENMLEEENRYRKWGKDVFQRSILGIVEPHSFRYNYQRENEGQILARKGQPKTSIGRIGSNV